MKEYPLIIYRRSAVCFMFIRASPSLDYPFDKFKIEPQIYQHTFICKHRSYTSCNPWAFGTSIYLPRMGNVSTAKQYSIKYLSIVVEAKRNNYSHRTSTITRSFERVLACSSPVKYACIMLYVSLVKHDDCYI